MSRRGWPLALAVAIGLALASLATHVTTPGQLSGEADTQLAARFTISKLLNSGTAWAGLAVLSGWLLRRPLPAAAAGAVSCLLALVTHYGLGTVVGLFDAGIWASNSNWFAAAMILGGPLGLVGAIARRPDHWGLAARLVVPIGAILEPFATGMFADPGVTPWPGRASSLISGMILIVTGTVGCAVVLMVARRSRTVRTQEASAAA